MATRVAPQEYQKVTFTKTVTFTTGDINITFIPIHDLPGLSHKVLVTRNGELLGKDWLDKEFHPTHKTAEFFYNKIVNGVYKD